MAKGTHFQSSVPSISQPPVAPTPLSSLGCHTPTHTQSHMFPSPFLLSMQGHLNPESLLIMTLKCNSGDPLWNEKVPFQPQARALYPSKCGYPSRSPGRLPIPADIPGVWDTSFQITSPLLGGEALKPPLSTLQRLLDLYYLVGEEQRREIESQISASE